MEVHSHSHTARKKWSHYFWEFFMLFLAVTLGFFVENQREHLIEHRREKQFIQSLINDIQADTARLNDIIKNRILREQRLDSLTAMLNNPARDQFTNAIYIIAVTVARTSTVRFIPNDGTIQQLKNSGGLRLIRMRAVADSIAGYDVTNRFLVQQGELEASLIQDYRTAAARIFNALLYDKMMDEDNNVRSLDVENPLLLTFTQADLDLFNYRLFSIKAINKAIRRDARMFLRQAENLLNTLKREYHLE